MNNGIINLLKMLFYFIIAMGKSIWEAFYSIVWGFAGIFLLLSLINYYKQDSKPIADLLIPIIHLENNWKIFFMAIFLFSLIINLKELFNSPQSKIESGQEVK